MITGMSRNTINKYKEMLDKHPLSYKELIRCSDKELSSIVYPVVEEKPVHEQLYGLFAGMEYSPNTGNPHLYPKNSRSYHCITKNTAQN